MIRKHAKRIMIMIMLTAIAALPLYGCGAGNSTAASNAPEQGEEQARTSSTSPLLAGAVSAAPHPYRGRAAIAAVKIIAINLLACFLII